MTYAYESPNADNHSPQCFLQAGDDFCKLEYKKDDLSDLEIKLDRSKILTTGREGMWSPIL